MQMAFSTNPRICQLQLYRGILQDIGGVLRLIGDLPYLFGGRAHSGV